MQAAQDRGAEQIGTDGVRAEDVADQRGDAFELALVCVVQLEIACYGLTGSPTRTSSGPAERTVKPFSTITPRNV